MFIKPSDKFSNFCFFFTFCDTDKTEIGCVAKSEGDWRTDVDHATIENNPLTHLIKTIIHNIIIRYARNFKG